MFPFFWKKNKDLTFLLYKSIFQKVVCYLVCTESIELEGKLISLFIRAISTQGGKVKQPRILDIDVLIGLKMSHLPFINNAVWATIFFLQNIDTRMNFYDQINLNYL